MRDLGQHALTAYYEVSAKHLRFKVLEGCTENNDRHEICACIGNDSGSFNNKKKGVNQSLLLEAAVAFLHILFLSNRVHRELQIPT